MVICDGRDHGDGNTCLLCFTGGLASERGAWEAGGQAGTGVHPATTPGSGYLPKLKLTIADVECPFHFFLLHE